MTLTSWRGAVRWFAALSILFFATNVLSQTVVTSGKGTFASEPPAYKSKSVDRPNSGFNASAMLSRKIYADEMPAQASGALQVPGRPLPTNDWWTDLLNNRFSGSMWSYPAMIRTSAKGVEMNYPSYWADAGKEIKSRSSITLGAADFQADAAIASDWHDWDVSFRMPGAAGNDGEIRTTMAHGSPFIWLEYCRLAPEVRFSASPEIFAESNGKIGIKIGDDLYGLYFPKGVSMEWEEGSLRFEKDMPWLVAALLRNENDLDTFQPYATSIPRDTRVEWTYDERTSVVQTHWSVDAENLESEGGGAPVLQGFLPHAYKYALPGAHLSYIAGESFMTPRGSMRLAASESGEFSYSYQFSGMLPYYAAPTEEDDADHAYSEEIMNSLMQAYADGGSFGGDTYWGGKGLVQMAMNMTFAKTTGHDELYHQSRNRLREALEDWLTYTPGENTTFFSYYPRWGGMLGFDVSYDSDAFNDHHFHFGYFTYAAALLCLEDSEFASDYGELLTLIAKDYANWDRSDTRFPFLRTLDPWCGHSWAGGLGDAGNDNGNGQESTSEAMQGWGGIYLLGVALNNREMRDAGIFGWSTEARATREYWYDVDSPRPANAGGRKAWPGKGEKVGNYNYDEYPYAYNSNITGKGIGWWTWFGGDPLYMHGIQWMPASPALDYLSWDPDFTAWAYDDMMSGANSTFSHKWFETTENTVNGDPIEPLALNDWGNVTLAYLQRSNPSLAAEIFDTAYGQGLHIAKAVSTGHISYYLIHSHLTHGEQDFTVHADMPTSQAYIKDGVRSYMAYNPGDTDRKVSFFDPSGAILKSFNVPPRKLCVFTADPHADAVEISSAEGAILPPGESSEIFSRVIDQYGATFASANPTLRLSDEAPATLERNTLKIKESAALGTEFSILATSGTLEAELRIVVNEKPEPQSYTVTGIPQYIEVGSIIKPSVSYTDQYGNITVAADGQWSYLCDDIGVSGEFKGSFTPKRAGNYTFSCANGEIKIERECFVMPALPLISGDAAAVASSSENAGSLPVNVNDGDTSTRWGSAHTDDEWIYLDLGRECYISRASVLWETAYGASYLFETSDDATSWTPCASASASGAGTVDTPLGVNARYVRLKGVKRGTEWGYSIYEFNLFGLDSAVSLDEIIGIDFALPTVMDQNETLLITPLAFTRSGVSSEPTLSWHADLDAEFSGNSFTPKHYGLYTLTGTLDNGSQSSAQIFVNEKERLAYVTLSGTEFETFPGASVEITPVAMNQFMAPYAGGLGDIRVAITPTQGASYDIDSEIFTATMPGEYTLDFSGLATAKVTVIPIEEANLALLRPAKASSERDGNSGDRAVDGRTDTRWESEWADEQWISVDLGEPFVIDRMEIEWEGAYAREYSVQVSLNGTDWTEVYTNTDGKGGLEEIAFTPVPARHVRLNCHKRALTAYGNSLYELRVFGRDRYTINNSLEQIAIEDGSESWYTLSGFKLSAKPTLPGIYIHKTPTAITKEIIR